MADLNTLMPQISPEILDVMKSLPTEREVRHCGGVFRVSPFEFNAACPTCGQRIKVRAFSGGVEIEDLFDTVFTWMTQTNAAETARQRIAEIRCDSDE